MNEGHAGVGNGTTREEPMPDWNAKIIEEFRANAGAVGGPFEGATMLLLHTTGHRSGREHVTPLVYLPDGERWVVFGSKGGAPADPDWVRNLEANPEATIEVGEGDGIQTIPVRATVTRDEPERSELYARQIERMPGFASYIPKVEGIRTIPAVILQRVS
jgi:deazaflavin-dependent oxidoreductase (nitroreductase family)